MVPETSPGPTLAPSDSYAKLVSEKQITGKALL